MKNKKIVGLLILGIIISFSILFIYENDYVENVDAKLLKTNDYYDESPGIPILGTTENIFSICQWNGDMEHHNLYFYNISLGGSLYKVDLDNPQFVPILVRGYLGDVYDIDTSYAPNGDMIFFATGEYDNAIMKMNMTTLVYEKILSSPLLPLKLSVDFDYRFRSIFIAWRTEYNVYAWNTVTKEIYNIETDFYSYFDERTVQCDGYDILYYNSEEIIIYSTHIVQKEWKRIVDTGITSVFWDTTRDYIIYAQDDDYTNYANGKIIQYDYLTDEIIYIQSNVDYPISIWCTSNYVYWLERGYWSSRSMIYRYSYYGYDTHYYSKVSRAHGVMWADRIEFQNEYSYSLNRLGMYWGYEQLYIINGSDITPPDKIRWMGADMVRIVNYDSWSISWWDSYDLNGIEDYELIVSETEDFSNYDTYWISEPEEHSYASLEFSDMEYGDYYYKVRTRDTMGLDPMEESNIGKWSNILKITYPNPETSDLSNRITDILPIIIILSIIGVVIGFGIGIYIIYRRRKQKDIE